MKSNKQISTHGLWQGSVLLELFFQWGVTGKPHLLAFLNRWKSKDPQQYYIHAYPHVLASVLLANSLWSPESGSCKLESLLNIMYFVISTLSLHNTFIILFIEILSILHTWNWLCQDKPFNLEELLFPLFTITFPGPVFRNNFHIGNLGKIIIYLLLCEMGVKWWAAPLNHLPLIDDPESSLQRAASWSEFYDWRLISNTSQTML